MTEKKDEKPRKRKKAGELTTEGLARRLFGREGVREAKRKLAEEEKKSKKKPPIEDKDA